MFSYIKNETCTLYTPTAVGVSNQTANIVPQYQKDTTLYLPVCLNTGTKNVYAFRFSECKKYSKVCVLFCHFLTLCFNL